MVNSLNSSNRKRKWIFLGIGLVASAISLFSYNFWRKNKEKNTGGSKAPDIKAAKPKTDTTAKPLQKKAPVKKAAAKAATKKAGPPPKTASTPKAATKTTQAKTKTKTQKKPFPLKSGDKNTFVKNFQQA